LRWEMLVHIMALWSTYIFNAIWYILRSYGMLYGHLVYFSRFGILYKDKSGNPGRSRRRKNPRKSRQHLVLTDGCKRQEGLSRASSLQLDFPRSQSIILPTNYQWLMHIHTFKVCFYTESDFVLLRVARHE
jgi:hypothetical protein